mmetsp:Transcript_44067/g.93804  ORF Transcript_44067/g.93804 Transcript_44067/m.93804 type:complete len:239 (-) Transcript_44067:997-1713(-)
MAPMPERARRRRTRRTAASARRSCSLCRSRRPTKRSLTRRSAVSMTPPCPSMTARPRRWTRSSASMEPLDRSSSATRAGATGPRCPIWGTRRPTSPRCTSSTTSGATSRLGATFPCMMSTTSMMLIAARSVVGWSGRTRGVARSTIVRSASGYSGSPKPPSASTHGSRPSARRRRRRSERRRNGGRVSSRRRRRPSSVWRRSEGRRRSASRRRRKRRSASSGRNGSRTKRSRRSCGSG